MIMSHMRDRSIKCDLDRPLRYVVFTCTPTLRTAKMLSANVQSSYDKSQNAVKGGGGGDLIHVEILFTFFDRAELDP
jgi:hypothetical protein